jgi:hypothetical protein
LRPGLDEISRICAKFRVLSQVAGTSTLEAGSFMTATATTQSFEPEDFPETAEKPAIGGLLRLRFSLRGDRFWP